MPNSRPPASSRHHVYWPAEGGHRAAGSKIAARALRRRRRACCARRNAGGPVDQPSRRPPPSRITRSPEAIGRWWRHRDEDHSGGAGACGGIEQARREAMAAFGDGTLYVERLSIARGMSNSSCSRTPRQCGVPVRARMLDSAPSSEGHRRNASTAVTPSCGGAWAKRPSHWHAQQVTECRHR